MDKERIRTILSREISENQILVDEPMRQHTSFKIGGNADLLVKVKNVEELKYTIKIAKKEGIHLTIIGNGSNILVKDKGIRGIVLKIEFEEILIEASGFDETKTEEITNVNRIQEEITFPKMEDVIVTVGAGVKLGTLAQKLLKEGITGFEFAAGIPGTIGGAVRMNAGAYGGEMKDIILETKCLDLEYYEKMLENANIDDKEVRLGQKEGQLSEIIILNHKEHDFAYRHSIFMDKKYIALETKLKLRRGKYEEIKAKMDEYLSSRIKKQPLQLPSAGSTFKRGTDYITAKLIDECGLKGYKIGGAKVSEKHAGFIVNEGSATAQNVMDLIKYVQSTVYKKTGKSIDLEIEILGE